MDSVTTSELQITLNRLVHSGSDSNPAFDALLHDYVKYHAVLAVFGGLLTCGLLALSIFSWTRFRRAPSTTRRRSIFRAFAITSGAVSLCLAVIVIANLSNALDPRRGFSGLVPALGTPAPGTEQQRVQQATNAWLRSGSAEVPPLLQDKIDERLSWQRPKAIVCSLLLIVFVVLCIRIWSRLIARASRRGTQRTLKDRAATASGGIAVACTLALGVMAVANTQAAIAPMTLTVLYG
jgi:prolipoprotein diacylglyceryltransferase